MPKGPNGEKRPADTIGCAVTVGRIATGQVEEIPAKGGRVRSGQAGAAARAAALSGDQRREIAKKAAEQRWKARRPEMTTTQCETLAVRFKTMAENGLVDAKFFLRNLDEAVNEQVCAEVNAMYDAYERGDCTRLDFKDSRR